MNTLKELYGLCGCGVSYQASQDELDQLGLLLDRLEQIELWMDTSLSRPERRNAEVEMEAVTDRIQLLMEKV